MGFCRTITINPLEALPNIFASNLPLCPIPATGSVTSTFTADLDVDWNSNLLELYHNNYNFRKRCPTGCMEKWIFRDSMGYGGNTSCSSGIRNFTVRIPDDPVFTRTSTATNETVCQGEAITPVTFSVNGYSVIGIMIQTYPMD